jgi:hypothetical protein
VLDKKAFVEYFRIIKQKGMMFWVGPKFTLDLRFEAFV